jgi:hypothetical protein
MFRPQTDIRLLNSGDFRETQSTEETISVCLARAPNATFTAVASIGYILVDSLLNSGPDGYAASERC